MAGPAWAIIDASFSLSKLLLAMISGAAALEQAPVERHELPPDALGREIPLDKASACISEPAPKIRIKREPVDRPREPIDVAERDHEGINFVTCDLAASRNVGRNERASAGGRLQQAQRQSFAVRWQRSNVHGSP